MQGEQTPHDHLRLPECNSLVSAQTLARCYQAPLFPKTEDM